ncbi:unnamed protein product [Trichogramma brassicae]|uniref:Uncharacterized protein n=1 Tax=Trichogramma brassicae TaxID=86971 RepID=A0A6H5IDV3_9HYME|nr:unnamed protein product [Trichogramma brassicae]
MSSSNSIFGERSQVGVDAVDKHVEHPKLEKLNRLHKAFIGKFENHRNQFVHEFRHLIRDWNKQLPNLLDIFTKQEIDWLLVATVKSIGSSQGIVEFVIRSGYKDEPDLDEDGKPILRRTTAVHQIAQCHSKAKKTEKLRQLFKIYDKFHVNYTDELGYTHFYIACKYDLVDVAEKFLELGQDPNCLVPETGDSILFFVAAANLDDLREETILTLLKHGADPRLANKDGRTPLHVICQNRSFIAQFVISMLLENVNELQRTALINAQDKWGDTPLHLALKRGDYGVQSTAQELLKHGADLSLANAQGQTPLHVICQECNDSYLVLRTLLEDADDLQRTVPIDAQDKWGDTPLLLALKPKTDRCDHNAHTDWWNDTQTIRELLRRGADPSLADAKGQTALHVICQRYDNGNLLRLFFEICDEFGNTVQIDAQDNEGNTPLHLATSCEDSRMVEPLLRRGADPCLANAEGLTPLLIAASTDVHGFMMKPLAGSINGERQQTARIDARDADGRTALEWAVTRCWPHIVKMLLDGGADVSGFVFPTASDSDSYGEIDNRARLLNVLCDLVNNYLDAARENVLVNYDLESNEDCRVNKLAAVTGLLAIVELLGTSGYKLVRADALKTMRFFDKYGLYESTDFPTSKDVDDLVDTLFDEMAKKPTNMDDFEFASSHELHTMIPRQFMKACCLRLWESCTFGRFPPGSRPGFTRSEHHVTLVTNQVEILYFWTISSRKSTGFYPFRAPRHASHKPGGNLVLLDDFLEEVDRVLPVQSTQFNGPHIVHECTRLNSEFL